MSGIDGRVIAVLCAVALLVRGGPGVAADPAGAKPNCWVSSAVADLGGRLDRTAKLIAEGRGVTILAIGSSSTQGVGASSPAMSYPSRLEADLRRALPGVAVRVVNDGHRGQDVAEEFGRLSRDAVDEHPDLVIWQVGTNALLRREDLRVEGELITRGAELLKQRKIDVVLMDMQYAPRVVARRAANDMEELIAATAQRERVGLSRRFAMMREWSMSGQLSPASLIGPDGLHMTDVSYRCLARVLAQLLVGQWQPHGKLAQSSHRNSAAIADRGPAGAAAAR